MPDHATKSRPTSGTLAVIVVASVLMISAVGNLVAQWSRITSDLGFAMASLTGMVLPLLAVTWGVHRARQTMSS